MKTDLDVRELTGHREQDEDGNILAPNGKESNGAEIAYATIEWLGYIRAKEPHYPIGFRRCVLTAEGLKILKATACTSPRRSATSSSSSSGRAPSGWPRSSSRARWRLAEGRGL